VSRYRLAPGLICVLLSGCGPAGAPDSNGRDAARQAANLQQGTIIGVRKVTLNASDAVRLVADVAVDGFASTPVAARVVTRQGGLLSGDLAVSAGQRLSDETAAFEYIIRKADGDLICVTQKDAAPFVLRQKVRVVAGNHARVVPDFGIAAGTRIATSEKPSG